VGDSVTCPAIGENRNPPKAVREAVTGGTLQDGPVSCLMAGDTASPVVPGGVLRELVEGLPVAGSAVSARNLKTEKDRYRHVRPMAFPASGSDARHLVGVVTFSAVRLLAVSDMTLRA